MRFLLLEKGRSDQPHQFCCQQNRSSVSLTKLPGSVQGQPFNIANCHNCTILILDNCDQIQIDDCTNTKIFIGACSESIFTRDCKNCTLTIACKQLRTRDCKDCTYYLYCKTEPIIETSSGMHFACFNGAYEGHRDAMKAANLVPEENLWYSVYDFNDEEKTGKNWSILVEHEEDGLWCPMGPADNCCPRVEVGGQIKPPCQKGNGIIFHKDTKHYETHLEKKHTTKRCVERSESREVGFDLLYHWAVDVCSRTKSKTEYVFAKVWEWFSNSSTEIWKKAFKGGKTD